MFKTYLLDLGWLFLPFAMLVIVGAANAVNLTDGLDGLAIMPVMIAAGSLGIIAYVVGRVDFTDYLDVHYVPDTGEILIFVAALIGGGLGFLWYNAPPAAVFMGDTGSLALGGALGAIAVATKHEIVLAIIGGLFVVEALSVIIQVAYYKRTKKRVFLMAPIHHHFEKLGWAEPQIVIRFWIVSLILAIDRPRDAEAALSLIGVPVPVEPPRVVPRPPLVAREDGDGRLDRDDRLPRHRLHHQRPRHAADAAAAHRRGAVEPVLPRLRRPDRQRADDRDGADPAADQRLPAVRAGPRARQRRGRRLTCRELHAGRRSGNGFRNQADGRQA